MTCARQIHGCDIWRVRWMWWDSVRFSSIGVGDHRICMAKVYHKNVHIDLICQSTRTSLTSALGVLLILFEECTKSRHHVIAHHAKKYSTRLRVRTHVSSVRLHQLQLQLQFQTRKLETTNHPNPHQEPLPDVHQRTNTSIKKMTEATPRVTQSQLQQFSHQTVRLLGKVQQLRGEQAVIDAGGQVTVFLNRVC